MPPLSPRLRALADRVLPGLPMVDVGTDHGLLPLALVQEGRVPGALGIDRNAPPLRAARERVVAAGLDRDPRLRFWQGDGIPSLDHEVGTVVIAGMGGHLIRGILGRARLDRIRRFVLQPNTDIPELRDLLPERGLRLVDEEMVQEGRQFFTLLVAEPGPALHLDAAQRLLGPHLLRARAPVFLAWLQREEARLARALQAAQGSRDEARLREALDLVQGGLQGSPG